MTFTFNQQQISVSQQKVSLREHENLKSILKVLLVQKLMSRKSSKFTTLFKTDPMHLANAHRKINIEDVDKINGRQSKKSKNKLKKNENLFQNSCSQSKTHN